MYRYDVKSDITFVQLIEKVVPIFVLGKNNNGRIYRLNKFLRIAEDRGGEAAALQAARTRGARFHIGRRVAPAFEYSKGSEPDLKANSRRLLCAAASSQVDRDEERACTPRAMPTVPRESWPVSPQSAWRFRTRHSLPE